MPSVPRPFAPGIVALALALAGGAVSIADDGPAAKKAARPAKAAARPIPVFTPEREAAALVFVRRHHAELEPILQRLAAMNRAEYEKAIAELFATSESLAAMKSRDERRYEIAIDAWRSKSRVELLTAQIAGSRDPSPALEAGLREAIADGIDADIHRYEYERELAEARLAKADEALARLRDQRDTLIETRNETVLKRARRLRRSGDSDSSAATAAKTNANAVSRPEGNRP